MKVWAENYKSQEAVAGGRPERKWDQLEEGFSYSSLFKRI